MSATSNIPDASDAPDASDIVIGSDVESGPRSKPVPRKYPSSPSRRVRIKVQNRRREYLHRHPSYFDSLDHELADPVLYADLVKQFQTAQEREEEGKAKGYGRTLEASLIRGETNLASLAVSNALDDNAVAFPFADLSMHDTYTSGYETVGNGTASHYTTGSNTVRDDMTGSVVGGSIVGSGTGSGIAGNGMAGNYPARNGTASNGTTRTAINDAARNGTRNGTSASASSMSTGDLASGGRSWDEPVSDRDEGLAAWREFLELRFVQGQDDDFDYSAVDDDEDLDALQHKDAEDDWYDDEEPSWVDDDDDTKMRESEQRQGETGIQDF